MLVMALTLAKLRGHHFVWDYSSGSEMLAAEIDR